MVVNCLIPREIFKQSCLVVALGPVGQSTVEETGICYSQKWTFNIDMLYNVVSPASLAASPPRPAAGDGGPPHPVGELFFPRVRTHP